MMDLTTLFYFLLLLVTVATAAIFLSSAMSFTPGRLRKMVGAGGIVVGLMMVGEIFIEIGHYYKMTLSGFEYLGYALVLAAFLIFAMVMYEASRFDKLFGFKESAFIRKMRGQTNKR